ncbi:MAG: antibiotic biosynthesis monooxygenase, partial [Parasphingorhabdus sp.]
EYKVLERYVDQEALDAHGKSDHFRASGPKLAPCMAAAPVIERLDGI